MGKLDICPILTPPNPPLKASLIGRITVLEALLLVPTMVFIQRSQWRRLMEGWRGSYGRAQMARSKYLFPYGQYRGRDHQIGRKEDKYN